MTRNFALLLWLLPRRIRSAWGLLAVTAFGVLAAVTIMALGAMYSQGLAEAGLRHSLAVTSATVINTQIVVRNRPLGPEDYAALRTNIEQIIDDNVGYLRRGQNRYAKMLPTLPFVQVGAPFGISDVPLGRPFFVTEFEEHSRLVDGQWPTPTVQKDAGACINLADGCPRIEGVLGLDTSRLMGWGVGKQAWLMVYPEGEDAPAEYIGVDIVGIAEANDPREEYWMGSADYFRMGDWEGRPVAPIYVNERAFFEGIGNPFPTLVGDYGWHILINPDVITAPTVQQTRDDLTALETDINSQFRGRTCSPGWKTVAAPDCWPPTNES